MDRILENLEDPSWWFTGIFFIAVGLLLAALVTRWIPRWYQQIAGRVPGLLKQYARKRQLKRLRRIRSLRFHPLLVIREIVRVYAMIVITAILAVFLVVFYTTLPEELGSAFRFLLTGAIAVPIYVLQVTVMLRQDFLRELLASCRRVGTTRCCNLSVGPLGGAMIGRGEEKKATSQIGPAGREPNNADKQLAAELSNSKWKFPDGKVITLQADGTIHKSWGMLTPPWEIRGGRLHYEDKTFEFTPDYTRITEFTKKEFQGEGQRLPS